MEAQVNGISLSPKSDELAVFVYTRLPSHGSIIRGERIDVADFSSRVFNDTGLAHHRKKEWAKAIELFTRAVYADPRRELPAYNLACALARAGDPRAEEALRYAITLGGDTVRARAAKERDFEGVRSTPWYGALTKP
jgi:tetratricopeptide (TPR) repeat protein